MSQRIFSGIQPSGTLHLGNYLGAIKNWVNLQDKYESIFCVVDLHAITTPQKPEELRKKTLEVAKIYLAAGIDTQKSMIFVQSHVPEHTELAWILNTITKMSDLFRMTQFKVKSEGRYILKKKLKGEVIERKVITPEQYKEYLIDRTRVGIFTYPTLMAADILLYDTNVVPVGEDQIQHVEFAKEIAGRFNSNFGETFVIPEPRVIKEGMRIMGLDDPEKKMSKSATSEYNYIALTDDPDIVREKIKLAVTDSGKEIKYSEKKPAIRNLINIYALLDNAKPKEIEESYRGKGYAEFKKDLAEIIVDFLKPFQEKYDEIDDREVAGILERGAKEAKKMAKEKMEAVKEKIGLI
ncbi:MAG: tryptophan--tRNA ligase [Candidatus Moranbacteria bacterium RBG_13_45_13]|nr:MAG: tryptophan--tRNA ligase [Candidatus Moranbacteria bacterium RBG_13_45_13]